MKKIYVIKVAYSKEVVKICLTKKAAIKSMKRLTRDRYIYEIWPVSTVGMAYQMDAKEWEK